MLYYFDDYGWLSDAPIDGRSTDIVPPTSDIPNGFAANFTGYSWEIIPYVQPPDPDPNVIAFNLGLQVSNHLNIKARERGYDDMTSICTYVTSVNPKYKSEAESAIAWRDAVWMFLETVLEEVNNGVRPVPKIDELIAELPVLEWPS